jgi:hypothetical protein
MAKLIVDDLAVCESCLCFIANGDAGTEEDNAAAIKGIEELHQYYEVPTGMVVPAGNENEEGYFSWRACDCCHRELGGMRYKAAIIG